MFISITSRLTAKWIYRSARQRLRTGKPGFDNDEWRQSICKMDIRRARGGKRPPMNMTT